MGKKMTNHRIIVLGLLVATGISVNLFGSEQSTPKFRIMQFLVQVSLPYVSPWSGTLVGKTETNILEAYDRTNLDDQKRMSETESQALLHMCRDTVLLAHNNVQQTQHSCQKNGKFYKTDITPILNTNNTCDKLTVIMQESQQ
jgi:hypothetical protein